MQDLSSQGASESVDSGTHRHTLSERLHSAYSLNSDAQDLDLDADILYEAAVEIDRLQAEIKRHQRIADPTQLRRMATAVRNLQAQRPSASGWADWISQDLFTIADRVEGTVR